MTGVQTCALPISLEVWWVSFACLIRFFFFLGLKLLDCVMFLFGVKMKENNFLILSPPF